MKVKFLQIKRALTATLFILIMLAGMTKMMAQDLMRVSKDALMQPMQQKVIDRDSGLNIESDVNNAIPSRTTRTNGELDYTTYDWQSNGTAITRTIVWPDGKINFAYTMASQSNFSDRGTGIGTYDAVNDEWAPSYGRIEAEKTGFGSIARYGQNGIVVAAHTAVLCGVYIIDDKDNITDNSVSVISYIDNTYEPTWPNVMTSGSNRNIIHVVATPNSSSTSVPGAEGVTQPILYFRSLDGGQTWDKQNFILPYMDANYGLSWGSNVCYWMETTEDNCLALVVNNPWSDGMVIYSYDDGETWERKVFYKHPNPFGTFDNAFLYPRYTSCQWDSQHHLHVLYEFNGCTGEPGSGNYYPGIGGVAYWNETLPYNENGTTQSAISGNLTPGLPFVMDSAYLYNDIYNSWWLFYDATHEMWPEYIGYLPALDDEGNWEDPYTATQFNIGDRTLHGNYHNGICSFPVLCMVSGSDEMVAVWCAMDENNTDGSGNYYYKLFASYSSDGGSHWSNMTHLTNSFDFQSKECVYPQAAIVNGKLVIACQMDGTTGTYIFNHDSNPYDNYYQGLTFGLDELFGVVHITATTNPIEGGTINGVGIYNEGAVCTLTATANPGYCFLNWTENGEVVSSDAEYSFTVTEDRNLVANFIFLANHWTAEDFQNNMYMINVVLIDDVVQMTPALELGAFCNGECRGSEFPVEDEGNWLYFMTVGGNNGDDITFRLYDHALQQERILQCSNVLSFENNGLIGFDEPYEVHFSTIHYIVSATISPENAGTITGAGEYVLGTDVTLTATPNENYTFMYWTENDEVVSTDANYSFTITADRNLVAHFTLPLSVTVTANPTEGGSVIGMGAYDYGSTCTLTAIANEGYVFNYWRKNGTKIYYLSTYSFTVTEDIDLEAVFMPVDGVLIGESDTTNQYLPSYSFFKYTLSQQIYTQDEIGAAGEITTISYFNASNARTRNFDIYMVHTDKTAFESSTDWITVSESDLVFSGSVNMLKGTWTTFVLDTPFAYNGYSNLAIIFDDNSGSWTEAPFMACRVFNTNDNQAIRVYSDNTNYNPYNPGYHGSLMNVKNQIILGIISGQSCHLSQGWNWWSTYIEVGGAPGLTMLENALGENGLTIVSQNAFVSYNSQTGVWRGTLRSIDNASGYNIKVSESCTVVMNGAIATPEDHPITLSHGWNWMGYPVSVAQTVASAMSDFNPQTGDIVNGQNGFAVYRSNRWLPATFMMNPGESYMYYSNATENKTLVYAQGRGEAPTTESEECFWQADRHAYRENLCLMATVEVDGVEQRDETLELGAFVNDECRGSARLYYVEPIDRYIAFLTVTGEDEEQVEFRLMDQSKATSMSNDHIIFHGNAIIGNLDTPFVIHFGAMNGLTEMQLNASIYPNPMDRNMPFTLAIPEEETVVDILITNALGEVVRHNTGSLTTSNITGLSEVGVYLLKVACRSGNVYYGRLIVK